VFAMLSLLESHYLEPLTDLFEPLLVNQGIFVPFGLLLIEESGVPLPIPGDIIIAYTGYQVAKELIPYSVAFLGFLFAVLLGSSILYYLSSRFGQKLVLRFGRFLHLNERKLVTVEEKFKKYGPLVIIFGRHIPGFRVPITVFSGMSEVTYKTFIISTLISVVFWIPFYLSLGARLGPKTTTLLHGHPEYYFFAAVPLLIIIIVVLVSRLMRNGKKSTSDLRGS
jgi:membrane protein DedA with SNARE-associated domain